MLYRPTPVGFSETRVGGWREMGGSQRSGIGVTSRAHDARAPQTGKVPAVGCESLRTFTASFVRRSNAHVCISTEARVSARHVEPAFISQVVTVKRQPWPRCVVASDGQLAL